MESEEYTVVPIISEEWAIHSDENPFCEEMDCSCHEDTSLTGAVGEHVKDGLMTASEADNLYRGLTI